MQAGLCVVVCFKGIFKSISEFNLCFVCVFLFFLFMSFYVFCIYVLFVFLCFLFMFCLCVLCIYVCDIIRLLIFIEYKRIFHYFFAFL